MRNFKGFSILEVLIVISIMFVLAGVSIISYCRNKENAVRANVLIVSNELYDACLWSYEEKNGTFSTASLKAEIEDVTGTTLNTVEYISSTSVIKLKYNVSGKIYVLNVNLIDRSYVISESESGIVLFR